MKLLIIFCIQILCFCKHEVNSVSLPGPLVYVVTPSPRAPKIDTGRSAPFYYHNWIRRMDSPQNDTSSTTSTTTKPKTPDLIFAEFESGNGNNNKSIRKLLEREKFESQMTATTSKSRPIYVPDDEPNNMAQEENYGLPQKTMERKTEETNRPASDGTDYFAMYNHLYNSAPAPVYMPSTTSSTTTTTTTTTPSPNNVENIWHIIDSQKYDQYSGKWEEEPVAFENTKETSEIKSQANEEDKSEGKNEEDTIDENFALPGFGTNPGSGAENESRAIRTEPNIRFPYISLKPFQIKPSKKPLLNGLSNSKKSNNNMFTSLDNFYDIKNPVRGEAQDVVPMRQPVDRYNPAQPYLPPTDYGSKSKQYSPNTTPVKAVANLVPPPPPPKGNDFPTPTNYESFPPYPQAAPASNPEPPPPPPPPLAPKPVIMYQPPVDVSVDSGPDSDTNQDDGDVPQMDLGYRYKAPSSPKFLPTLPPLTKPFNGYSYDKPPVNDDSSPEDIASKPDFHGYHYSKPEPASPPQEYPSSYGHHVAPPYHHDSDYPELIYSKPHGEDTMKDMGMVPPPPPPDMKPDINHGPPMGDGPPSDDHGFPHDFPGDFKFHHDIDDDDYHHHHHHHHPTTTTTTTEMPRVNRYSYYYLGKKLYYLPLYFSVYFIIYVGALIIKAVLRHKIVYPNSWRPNDTTASFFSKRSIDSWDLSNENLHAITGNVTHALAVAGEKYMNERKKK